MSLRTAAVCIGLTLAAMSPLCASAQTPGASASPGAAESPMSVDPAVAARAKDWMRRVQNGRIDRSQLDDQMNRLLTDDLLKSVATQFGPLGEPTAFELVTRKTMPPNDIYVFKATFRSTTWLWIFATGPEGKIAGLRFVPPQ